MTNVVVYTKQGCHLCENVISTLQKLAYEHPFDMTTRNIEGSSDLVARYKNIIPVVEIDGKIRLGGSTLSDQISLESVLRRALFET